MPILNEAIDENFCKKFLCNNPQIINLFDKFEPKSGTQLSFSTSYKKLIKNLETNKKAIPERLCEVYEYNFMNLYSKIKQ